MKARVYKKDGLLTITVTGAPTKPFIIREGGSRVQNTTSRLSNQIWTDCIQFPAGKDNFTITQRNERCADRWLTEDGRALMKSLLKTVHELKPEDKEFYANSPFE